MIQIFIGYWRMPTVLLLSRFSVQIDRFGWDRLRVGRPHIFERDVKQTFAANGICDRWKMYDACNRRLYGSTRRSVFVHRSQMLSGWTIGTIVRTWVAQIFRWESFTTGFASWCMGVEMFCLLFQLLGVWGVTLTKKSVCHKTNI